MVQAKKKSLVLFMAILLSVFVMGWGAKADAYTNLSLNNTWAAGSVTQGGVSFYQFTVTRAGWVNIDYQGLSIYDSYFAIWNADQTTRLYGDTNVCYSSNESPKTSSVSLGLQPGTYVVKVWPYGSNSGTFRVRGTYSNGNSTETEPNNTFMTAMPIAANGSVNGFLAVNDTLDFFKINVAKTQPVQIIMRSMVNDMKLTIYDKDYLQVHYKNVCYASEESPMTYTFAETLAAGTYYIKVEPYSENLRNCGKYTLTYKPSIDPNATNGFSNKDGSWKFYKNGVVQTGYTGIVNGTISGKTAWYYVRNGLYIKTATGLCKRADGIGGWYYVKNGIYTTSATGICKRVDGIGGWYYVKNGVYNTASTGLCKRADGVGGWYYVRNGVYYTGATGICKRVDGIGGWYYVKNGVYNTGATGICRKADGTGGWYYIKNGVYNAAAVGVAKMADGSSSKLYYVSGGVYRANYTGYYYGSVYTYYIKNGVVQWYR